MEISEIYKGKSYHCQITSFKKKFKQLKKTQDTTPLNEPSCIQNFNKITRKILINVDKIPKVWENWIGG